MILILMMNIIIYTMILIYKQTDLFVDMLIKRRLENMT